jgi:hypothetical protein
MLTKSKPDVARRLFQEAQRDVESRWAFYQHLAGGGGQPKTPPAAAPAKPATADQLP